MILDSAITAAFTQTAMKGAGTTGNREMYAHHSPGTDEPPRFADSCHIHVRFENPPIEMDYLDDRTIAHRFAEAAARIGATVTIDGNLQRDSPPLPCRRLWT